MQQYQYVERMADLLEAGSNSILNMPVEEARSRVASGDPDAVRQIDGHFALLAKVGQSVRMARSLGRPMRYFLAKQADGPCLIVAERIDQIADWLRGEGLYEQFHPSYTRMVPAHYVLELQLIGCPDPQPSQRRFFTPQRDALPADLDEIGARYIATLADELDRWLDHVGPREPLGVLFSGGIDSGAVFLTLYDRLLRRGESPARLKAFTLSIDGAGADAAQAEQFLRSLDLALFLEVVDVPARQLDYRQAVRIIEDYKPLDVQSATMALALCQGIRQRYPDWRLLVDGDGGDENFKDYPIADNPELTIRSVLNNLMLYHEGWGVDAVKHSLTYSGGQSRGHVRSHAPARQLGFAGFSPLALPNVIEVSEGIPFVELTDWDESKLYWLKGEIVRRGVRAVTGWEMPVFEKRRFQHGAAAAGTFRKQFPAAERPYRQAFADLYADAAR
jgi:asparagine synthase (glutamine-hydrolysing)